MIGALPAQAAFVDDMLDNVLAAPAPRAGDSERDAPRIPPRLVRQDQLTHSVANGL